MNQSFRSALLALAVVSAASNAAAFCRTTICDARFTCSQNPEMCCIVDPATGCETNTAPISWPTSCVSYAVHEDGSAKRDISASELADTLDEAFDRWLSADCGGTNISLAIDYRGTAECGSPEYNGGQKDRNANIWMFRDSGTDTGASEGEEMELDPDALAVTTVNFNEETAEIYDVDVELLSSVADFTTGDEDVGVDLESVVTHEAGHFLGLDHTVEAGATMAARYFPGTTGPRTLSEDDEAGICAVYPEDRDFPGGKTCDPRGKYSPKCEGDGCGCRVTGAKPASSTPLLWLVGAVLAMWSIRRRRPSPQQ